jgi:hypothetical protein
LAILPEVTLFYLEDYMFKNLKMLVISFLFAILVGCGGGGGDVIVPATGQLSTIVSVATFSNVATNPLVTTVMPGELSVEVAAFRTAWKDQQHYPISQLVFKNKYNFPMWEMFKKFQLVDNNGNDVATEALYYVHVDDVKHEVVIDFFSVPWYAMDSQTSVPKTYSLLASVDYLAKDGTQFAFSLSAVQMHNAGQSAMREVMGRDFTIGTTVGKVLPVVTASSSSSLIFDNSVVGVVDVGNFTVNCPVTSQYGCVFTEIDFSSFGSTVPYITVDGAILTTTTQIGANNNYHSSFWYYIPPGETKNFVFNGALFGTPPTPSGVPIPLVQTVTTYVNNLVFTLGNTKVSPVLLTGTENCGAIVVDHRFCKV